MIQDLKAAVAELSEAFDTVRKTFDSSVHPELLGESFFVLTLSAYARLVWEFSENLVDNPPSGGGNVFGDFVNCVKSTWAPAALFEKNNLMFTLRYMLAFICAFCYSKYMMNNSATCVLLCTLLINTRVGPDFLATLNVLLAVIVGSLAGTIVFNHSCNSYYGNFILPVTSFFFWAFCLYPYMAGSKFGSIGLFAAAIGAPRIVALCPKLDALDPNAGALGMWLTMVAVMLAIGFNSFFEVVCSTDRAATLACKALDRGFKELQDSYGAFWNQEDIGTAIAPVAGTMNECLGFCSAADLEPRFWRADWKTILYEDIVDKVRSLRLDLLALESAMEGGGGSAAGLFDKFASQPSWGKIRKDLDSTLEDARKLSVALVSHETGPFTGLNDIDATANIDELEDLPELLKDLAKTLKLPTKAPSSMEDDEICKISSVLVMLEQTCAHIAQIVKMGLQAA